MGCVCGDVLPRVLYSFPVHVRIDFVKENHHDFPLFDFKVNTGFRAFVVSVLFKMTLMHKFSFLLKREVKDFFAPSLERSGSTRDLKALAYNKKNPLKI